MNIRYVVILLLSLASACSLCAKAPKKIVADAKKEFEIPLTEDLMREHAILDRVLLIYEEIMNRIDARRSFPLSTLNHAVGIIQTFIESYHEKLEEEYIFPLFEKNNKEVRLVRTLKKQHVKGREITAQVKKIISKNQFLSPKDANTIKSLLKKFVTMYRPHEARESTVLFPQIRSLMSEKEFEELGEKFEAIEHALFGEDGFEAMVHKVSRLEKELGIYQLEQFTPDINA